MKNKMLVIMAVALIGALAAGCSDSPQPPRARSHSFPANVPSNAVGVFVVIDGSGSMAENVDNSQGKMEQKYIIANRALISLGKRLDVYLNASPDRAILAGIVLLHRGSYFLSAESLMSSGSNGAENFFKDWVSKYPGPEGGTPLGWAIEKAAEEMNGLSIKSKHIIVITDGESNQGPKPEEIMPKLPDFKKKTLGIHFLAFDIFAPIFNPEKALGATFFGANNENELDAKLNIILNDKVLLEKEF